MLDYIRLIHDVAQQVFCEFLQNAEKRQWDIEGDIDGLFYTITRNVCSNLWRERRRETPEALGRIGEYLLQLNSRQAEEAGPEETEDEYRAMRQCLDRLPEKSRHVIKMRYFLEMPSDEIAGQLSIEPDSVRKTVARIRLRLRKCIEKTLRSQKLGHAEE